MVMNGMDAADCVRMRMAVMMVPSAAEEPGAGDVHREAEGGNRNGCGKINRNRR